MSGGRKANTNGRAAEDAIAAVLRARGFDVVQQATIGTSVMGTALRADLVVREVPGFPSGLIIESKWQGEGGSVQQKLLWLVVNVKDRYPLPTVIVLAGNGAQQKVLDWAKSQEGGRLHRVFTSLDDFTRWVLSL